MKQEALALVSIFDRTIQFCRDFKELALQTAIPTRPRLGVPPECRPQDRLPVTNEDDERTFI